jgi:hypothetical protein
VGLALAGHKGKAVRAIQIATFSSLVNHPMCGPFKQHARIGDCMEIIAIQTMTVILRLNAGISIAVMYRKTPKDVRISSNMQRAQHLDGLLNMEIHYKMPLIMVNCAQLVGQQIVMVGQLLSVLR